jgi:apolipoprotein N-acyltransferase
MNSFLLCLLSGLVLGFAQPFYMPSWFGPVLPHQHWFGLLAFVGYVPLFLAIANKNLKQTFLWAFFSLSVQFTIVFYWMYIALNVYGHIPPIFSGLITLLVPFLMALKVGVFLTMGRFLSQRFSVPFLYIAPFALCAGDYFRNFYVFGGFPWGNAGYAIGQIDQLLQVASLVGVYGLVFVVGLINALIAIGITEGLVRKGYRYVATAVLIVIVAFGYGALRLENGKDEFAPSVRVALLQGNIDQEMKSSARRHADEIINIYKDLHKQAKSQGAELIIWPESAYPRVISEDTSDLNLSFTDQTGNIIGLVAYGEDSNGQGYHVRNSALLMDYQGQIIKRYDKSHLVPFGEYVPWPMSGVVDKVVPGMGAFLPGTDYAVTSLTTSLGKTIKIGTTICYEGIFPEITRAYKRNGAELLVNITNDAWYGASSAPYQHLLMYRLRSVETGLPFVRATNSGISAYVDSYGRMGRRLPLFERGLIINNVPLLNKPTLYAAVGDVIPIISLLLMLIFYVAAVIPVHHFVKQRQYKKLMLIAGLSIIAIASNIYYNNPRFLTDESARTKNFLACIIVFLLMIGFLSKTKRSRSILLVCGMVIMLCSLGLALVESPYFLLGSALGLLIYLLALRIKIADKPV